MSVPGLLKVSLCILILDVSMMLFVSGQCTCLDFTAINPFGQQVSSYFVIPSLFFASRVSRIFLNILNRGGLGRGLMCIGLVVL